MKKIFYLFLFVTIVININAQDLNFEKDFFQNRDNLEFRDVSMASPKTNTYDLKHYRFNINIDPSISYISGRVTPTFLVTKENTNIYFDFNSIMTIDSIKYHNQKVDYGFTGSYELEINLPSKLINGQLDSLTIWYQGNPSTSGFGSFESDIQKCDASNTEYALWTLSEPYGARDWWPTKQSLNDKIDSIDMFVTTPKGYKVGSNGLLLSVKEKDNKLIHHWKHNYPEPAYLIAIAVSNYSEYIDWVPLNNGDSLMVLEYIYPCNLDDAKAGTPKIVSMIQFFNQLFGDYPFIDEKYGHAQFNWGGGMEHSSMTFVSGFNPSLLAHELAHQWFGDKITCGSWQDIWLNEGFATYLEGLTYDFGRSPYYWNKWKVNNKAKALGAEHGSVFVRDTSSVWSIFNSRLSYAKGAYLLHMLRWKLGDDDFFKSIHNYINDPKLIYNYARTKDLQKHLEDQSGQDLNEFFNDWFYGRGNPTYSFQWWYDFEGKLFIKVRQSQSDNSVDYFEMPIQIGLKNDKKDTTIVLNNEYNNQIFELDLDFKPNHFSFDPDNWLCANFTESTYLGTQSIADSKSISVFPNPTRDLISININKEIFVDYLSVYDINGKQVLNKSIKNSTKQTTISLKDLDSGIYLLKLISNSGVYSKKIIVE